MILKSSFKWQIIAFCFTLVLIAIAVFVFKNFTSEDYILIVIGVLELIGIIIALAQRKK